MNLNQMRIFYTVARDGCLTKAADSLCITQPAVSKALQRFQESLDVQLFYRQRNRLVATVAGEHLYELAEEIFELELKADALMLDFSRLGQSELRIDTSMSFGDYYLPKLIKQYCQDFPGIKINVKVMPTTEVVQRTLNMENDIAFLSYSVNESRLRQKAVINERLMIVTLPEDPLAKFKYITASDLTGVVLISHEKESAQQVFLDELERVQGLAFNRSHVLYSSNEAIKSALIEGCGVALMSERAVQREVKSGLLVAIPLGQKPLKRTFYTAQHKDSFVGLKVERFMNLLESI